VIGSAIALLLLSGGTIPLWGGVLLSVAVSFSMLLVERCGIRKLEGLFGVLISIMVGSFAVRDSTDPGVTGREGGCSRDQSLCLGAVCVLANMHSDHASKGQRKQ